MSRESILKIKETEDRAEAIVTQARTRAQEMVAQAEREGKERCSKTEAASAQQMHSTLQEIRERTEEMTEKVVAEAKTEVDEIRKKARMNRKIAEKIIIRGLDTKCR